VARLCRVLAVKRRQDYYEWLAGEPARLVREADDEQRRADPADQAEPRGYGSPRITAELRLQGLRINRKRVERVVRERGLAGITRRRRRSLTKPDTKAAQAPGLIRRDFTAPAPGVRLVGDITYLPTAEGWLYLATTIDLFNREVVGHAMATHMRAGLVCDAVELAHRRGLVLPGGSASTPPPGCQKCAAFVAPPHGVTELRHRHAIKLPCTLGIRAPQSGRRLQSWNGREMSE
jgi:transposase InsO family protein